MFTSLFLRCVLNCFPHPSSCVCLPTANMCTYTHAYTYTLAHARKHTSMHAQICTYIQHTLTGQTAAAKVLMGAGASTIAVNRDNNQPLHLACYSNAVPTIEVRAHGQKGFQQGLQASSLGRFSMKKFVQSSHLIAVPTVKVQAHG